jgi:hypothetical protein
MKGVYAVSSEKKQPFLTDKSFYEAMGFDVADTAPPDFVLMVALWVKVTKPPAFTAKAPSGRGGRTKSYRIKYGKVIA